MKLQSKVLTKKLAEEIPHIMLLGFGLRIDFTGSKFCRSKIVAMKMLKIEQLVALFNFRSFGCDLEFIDALYRLLGTGCTLV